MSTFFVRKLGDSTRDGRTGENAMTFDHATIERLARRMCKDSGGDWDKKYTKHAHWIAQAIAFLKAY